MHLPTGTRFFGRARLLLFVLFLPLYVGVANSQQGTVAGGELAVQTRSLPNGFVRREYRRPLLAEGGVAPLKWEISTGALPRGLVLSADGEVATIAFEPGARGKLAAIYMIRNPEKLAHVAR